MRWSGGKLAGLLSCRVQIGDPNWETPMRVSCRVQLGAPYNSALRLVLGDAEDFAEAGEAVLGELEAGLA